MTPKNSIQKFLNDFKIKMGIWDVLFRDDRGKNFNTLIELEIRPIDRKKISEDLIYEDFCEGPFVDKLYGVSTMWVFGKKIKHKDVYIKISMGHAGSSVICISFHIAEHPLNYPFKT